ncbi:MAG: hypothetical protein Q4C70_03035 [Planctomycetia bacterium]|nr:hypothetical protein [Planctomycetia bacterium]
MNETIYTFNGKNITMNVCIQIRGVLDVIQRVMNIDFSEAVALFYPSDTYQVLQETENALWAESAEFIANRFFQEIDEISI